MTDKTLFLAWQDKGQSREWFPIGRLDISDGGRIYKFRYVMGAKKAQARAGFRPLLDFPQWDRAYESSVLFPLFMNRIVQSSREDFPEYLGMLDLTKGAEPADILTVSGGQRT